MTEWCFDLNDLENFSRQQYRKLPRWTYENFETTLE